jgi:hypothetical protein
VLREGSGATRQGRNPMFSCEKWCEIVLDHAAKEEHRHCMDDRGGRQEEQRLEKLVACMVKERERMMARAGCHDEPSERQLRPDRKRISAKEKHKAREREEHQEEERTSTALQRLTTFSAPAIHSKKSTSGGMPACGRLITAMIPPSARFASIELSGCPKKFGAKTPRSRRS